MSSWPRTTAARRPTRNGSTSGPNPGSWSSASDPIAAQSRRCPRSPRTTWGFPSSAPGVRARSASRGRTMESPRVRFWTNQATIPRERSRHRRSGRRQVVCRQHRIADARSTGGARLLIGCVGFGLGAIACLVLAVIEFAAWVLIAPPRSIASRGISSRVTPAIGRAGMSGRTDRGSGSRRSAAGRPLAARPGAAASRDGPRFLLHGFAEASSALEARRAAALNRHGWNVAVLDSRGYGQSDGPYATFGGREAGDIRAWLEFLAERIARIDPALPFRPVLWGRSMGAAIAMRTAAAEPSPRGPGARIAHGRPRRVHGPRAPAEEGPLSQAHGPAGHAPGRQAGGRADSRPSAHRLGPAGHLSRP